MLDGQFIQFIVGFFIDSFKNTVAALMWPVWIVRYEPPFGPIALGIAFWLFPIVLKPTIEAWLFDGDEPSDETRDPDSSA